MAWRLKAPAALARPGFSSQDQIPSSGLLGLLHACTHIHRKNGRIGGGGGRGGRGGGGTMPGAQLVLGMFECVTSLCFLGGCKRGLGMELTMNSGWEYCLIAKRGQG